MTFAFAGRLGHDLKNSILLLAFEALYRQQHMPMDDNHQVISTIKDATSAFNAGDKRTPSDCLTRKKDYKGSLQSFTGRSFRALSFRWEKWIQVLRNY